MCVLCSGCPKVSFVSLSSQNVSSNFTECIGSAVRTACSGTSYVQPALPAVLKRATTIKRRGMDVVHRGQPGEEQYGDISSVGEWESGQDHKYVRHKV